eukprot:488403-Amphidinium_carterae.1
MLVLIIGRTVADCEDVNLIGANIEMAAASALPEEAPLYALCWLGFRALRRTKCAYSPTKVDHIT